MKRGVSLSLCCTIHPYRPIQNNFKTTIPCSPLPSKRPLLLHPLNHPMGYLAAGEPIDLANAGRAGDIHFGQVAANYVKANEI